MPRSKADVATDKITRLKDQCKRLEKAQAEARTQAGLAMAAALDADPPLLTRSQIALLWRTSLSQVDRMVAEARESRA